MTEVLKRGHSWNVNTQKEKSIRLSLGLCHASRSHFWVCIYFYFLLWVSRGKNKMTPYNSASVRSGPTFSPPPPSPVLLSLKVTSLGDTSVNSTPINGEAVLFLSPVFVFRSSCVKMSLRVILHDGENPELHQALSVRSRGCCSWCRFVWLRRLKEKKEREQFEKSRKSWS